MPVKPEETPSAEELVSIIESYLAKHLEAAVLEDGRVIFDLRLARCQVSESHGRCVLQLWSEERNMVRTVLSAQHRTASLRLMTRRMGAPKPTSLEIVPNKDRRTPTSRDTARRQYQRLLERVLARRFPEAKPEGFTSATDLEHSFGPAYVRGHLVRGGKGAHAEAVIAVGSEESPAMIDGILTLGLLWLSHCREHSVSRRPSRHYEGLKVIVPRGTQQTTAERMAWLNQAAAHFQLFTLDERSEELTEIDFRDTGNVASRLVRAFDVDAAIEKAASSIERVMQLVPIAGRKRVELRPRSAGEVALLLHGLEFARVRQATAAYSFQREEEITLGAGAQETRLTAENEPMCRNLLEALCLSRQAGGEHADPLFRMQPERWLESCLRRSLEEMLPGLRGEFLYSQVPAIGAGERGMLDLLTLDRQGRLVIIEVKADEDLHLPLQGLDYWLRVRALNADRQLRGTRETGAFEREGYFAGAEVAPRPPKLLLIAPALRIHPANETVLRFLSPQVEWELIAVGEHWRNELKVVFRKRSASMGL
ncbi:hypothetical protein ACFPT7_10420 [Acidicapsa dinghuensis]|uniref:DUF91 domain-containing protein n=1 Tax=Acidicapsa dinghuensis TaxID=2218256 RepID=A0ABW1EFF4_9BACT|nr:hypothetical protein [Acidicapsa dinghuensis]